MQSIPTYYGDATLEGWAFTRSKLFPLGTKKELLDFWAERETFKIPMSRFLAELIESRGYKSVLSLGAGDAVIESIQNRWLSLDRFTVSDFDPYVIERVRAFFPELEAHVLDIKSQAFYESESFLREFDVLQIIGLVYVLSDKELLRFLSYLRQVNIPIILAFTGDWIYPAMAWELRKVQRLWKRRTPKRPGCPGGRQRVWLRDESFIRDVIKRAGLVIQAMHYYGRNFRLENPRTAIRWNESYTDFSIIPGRVKLGPHPRELKTVVYWLLSHVYPVAPWALIFELEGAPV
ncbi:hypothetical protein MYX75_00185 [Acidobacteria bacterium AH-259-A15]|nr:hypothetical protein [Acidobacteria bacterium AH-259-A15]